MNNFIEFWENLGENKYLFLFAGVFFLYHLVSVLYKCLLICSKEKKIPQEEKEGISVIITSNNRAEELRKNLPYFLNQEDTNFDVIVVDECSEDETQEVLTEMQKKYSQLRTTRIFPETKFRSTKKLAINIGILAARYDVLLFSEINCCPASSHWVSAMRTYFTPDTAVVLGYANYTAPNGKVKIRRMFRFLRYLKMFLLVKRRCFVLGDGHNMGYRKKYYLAKKGFSKNSQSYTGYDNEMVACLSALGKVKVAKQEETYVNLKDSEKKTWKEDYTYYYQNKLKWPIKALIRSDFDTFIEFLFYIFCFILIFKHVLYIYIIACILLTFLLDFITINICLRHLKQRKLFLISFIVSSIGFLYRWYYNVHSIFTKKKWR